MFLPADNQPDSAHEFLRHRTRDCHLAAERAMRLPARLTSLQSYVDLLQRLWSIHASMENALLQFDWERIDIDFAARRRAHWLADDIVSLGNAPCKLAGLAVNLETLDEALGALYVLEGSTLGAQIILRQAILIPGVTVLKGARFFYGNAEHTTLLWIDFITKLDRSCRQGISLNLLERGAFGAFAEFILALQTN